MSEREREAAISTQVSELLTRTLPGDYAVHSRKSILYRIEVNALGKVTPDSVDSPVRGQFAFETDILIERKSLQIPLVVIELKSGGFSTHDVITYSSKAARHKLVYPYLRYGFVVVGPNTSLGRKFVTHNEGFDFAMAMSAVAEGGIDLVALVQRQIASAERLTGVMKSDRIRMSRYEENVEIV